MTSKREGAFAGIAEKGLFVVLAVEPPIEADAAPAGEEELRTASEGFPSVES